MTGYPSSLVIHGTVATFDEEDTVVRDGTVYLADGLVQAVQRASAQPPRGFEKARHVRTRGIVYPGLIDLHNHLAYNFLSLWIAPRETPYTTRYQWPGAATYGRDISNPAQAMGIAAAAATLRYAEVRAVVGGATAIQGSPPLTRAFPGWMVRNVEKERAGTGDPQRTVQSVLPATAQQLRKYAKQLKAGRSFFYHLAEGTAESLRKEFDLLDANGCVHRQLIGIHSTALRQAEFARWEATGGTVVWSPFSNLWLYGDTTDVLTARAHGLRVCLGSDWGPSGTKNILGELKVAALWNDNALERQLSARDLCEMATTNPGDTLALAWGTQAGRLVPGALGDVLVTSRRHGDVFESLLRAVERHVRLVVVGGRAVYGAQPLLRAAGARRPERVVVGGVAKWLDMSLPPELLPEDPVLAAQATMSWAKGLKALEAVRRDPFKAVTKARAAVPRGEVALEFQPDMPGPDGAAARALTDDELHELVIPPLDTLTHDAAFFRTVQRNPLHLGTLDGLRDRFR